jgi:threonine/homoserine/homoserine lactone efflux protein
MATLWAFVGVAALVIVTPGPDTALTIRNTLWGGRPGGVFTAVGVGAGQATWTLATSAGIAALLIASEPVFRALRFAGAAYLAYLGVQAFRSALHGGADTVARSARRPLAARAALRQGLISNLTNPKMVAFFPALLPQFVPAGSGAFLGLFGLGLLFSSLTLLWLSAYALAVAKTGDLLRRGPVRRLLEATTGLVLIGLGVRLATESQ